MTISTEFAFSVVLACVATIIWLVRLEGRINVNSKELELSIKRVDILHGKHDDLDSRIVQELARLREGIARIEGYMQKSRE